MVVDPKKVKEAEEAARAYADVLENHEEWKPVSSSKFNANSAIQAAPGSGIEWVKVGTMMQLVEMVYPYKGIRTVVEEIISEYRRRGRDNRSAEAGADSGYDASRTIAYNGTQPRSEHAARRRTSRAEQTSYAGASLKVVHDALASAWELGIKDQPLWFNHQVEVNCEVYGFRIQQSIELDEWLVPKLIPLNARTPMDLESQARCNKQRHWSDEPEPEHSAPQEDCTCGFYSVAHPKYLDHLPLKGKSGRHLGVVSQHWGKIIVGRSYNNPELVHGYRSEWQNVLCVVTDNISHTVKSAVEARGVEVYKGHSTMKEWWERIGVHRFDGLVRDSDYADTQWGDDEF